MWQWFIVYYQIWINAADTIYRFNFDYNEPSNDEWTPHVNPVNDSLCANAPCLVTTSIQSAYRSIITTNYHSISISLTHKTKYNNISSGCFAKYGTDMDAILFSYEIPSDYEMVGLLVGPHFNNNSFFLLLGAPPKQQCYWDNIAILGTPYFSAEPTKRPAHKPTVSGINVGISISFGTKAPTKSTTTSSMLLTTDTLATNISDIYTHDVSLTNDTPKTSMRHTENEYIFTQTSSILVGSIITVAVMCVICIVLIILICKCCGKNKKLFHNTTIQHITIISPDAANSTQHKTKTYKTVGSSRGAKSVQVDDLPQLPSSYVSQDVDSESEEAEELYMVHATATAGGDTPRMFSKAPGARVGEMSVNPDSITAIQMVETDEGRCYETNK